MAFTVQNIIDAAQRDLQLLVGSNHPALIDYTDRISQEILRTSRWTFLLSGVQSFTTVAGETDYFIGTGAPPAGSTDTGLALTDVSTIKQGSVIDRTNFVKLFRTDEQPIPEKYTQNGRPLLWRHDVASPTVINLYPPADGVYTIEFRYYKVRAALTLVGDTLQIPDVYKDVVIAGVAWLAATYLDNQPEKAAVWLQIYKDGLRQIIRDRNLHPRTDFLAPDSAGVDGRDPDTPIEVVF